MRDSKRNLLATITIVGALFLFAALTVANLSSFASPIGSDINFVKGNAPQLGPGNSDGLLLITVEANLTVLPVSSNQTLAGFRNEPLRGVFISISNTATNSGALGNTTNSVGQLAIYLPPSSYAVSFQDWRFNYSTVTVSIFTGQVTHLGAYLNATTYSVQSFNIVDPDDSGWALGWEQVYANVVGPQHVSQFDASTYLETGTLSAASDVLDGGTTSLTQVTILGNLKSQNSQWLNLEVDSAISISSIQNLQLLSMSSIYLVYPA